MDIGLREWLIIGGVLVIGLIIFDGWRRVRGQRDTLKIDIDGKFTEGADFGEDGHHNPELPNGGARLKPHEHSPPSSEQPAFNSRQDYAPAPARPAQHAKVADNPTAYNKTTASDNVDSHALDLGISAHQDSPLSAPDFSQPADDPYVAEAYDVPASEPEPVKEPKPEPLVASNVSEKSQQAAVDYQPAVEPAVEPAGLADNAQESIEAVTSTSDDYSDIASDNDEDIHELDPLFDDIPEIVSRPRPAASSAPDVEPEFTAIDDVSEPHQVPTSDIIHQDLKDPVVAAAINAEETTDIDPLTLEQHDANAYGSYKVHTPEQMHDEAEAPDDSPTSEAEVANERSDEKSEADIDLEQPVTVLMRQFTAEREEARIQQEMFDMPEPEPAHASVKDSGQGNAKESAVSQLAAKAQAVASALSSAKRKQAAPEQQSQLQPQPQSEPEWEQEEPVETAPLTPQPEPKKAVAQEPAMPAEVPEQDSLFDDPLIEGAHVDRKAREHPPEPDEVLVITVVGKEQPLNGKQLLKLVLACEMRHGDMDLFHRFEDGIDKGAVQFSMANAVNPGTFQLETMADMETRGVSFFMSMSEPEDPKNAFECMLATAETVAAHLDGDLLDENHSVMGSQTKMHYRERIREHEMHKRIRRGR
ncbi:cell division protein ZipA [Neptunomonas phycophila]|uniref:cell division protein ZipA n=1 Tax=Neptunomonas phycophila TaxID=1572645 RepID=UPI0030FC5858